MRRVQFLCAAIALVSALMAHAQPLSLQQAVSRTLERNPALAVIALESEAQDGVRLQAGARPAIEAGLLVENVGGSGALSGVGRSA